MKIEYRKLASPEDFSQCISLQQSLFGLSDIEVVSPLLLQLFARENPPTGLMLGAFEDEKPQTLIGFIIAIGTFRQQSIYGIMVGVIPQYRNHGIGLNLFLELREHAIKENIKYFYGVFEPLEQNLGHLYFRNLGFKGIFYQEPICFSNDNEPTYIPADKILLRWDLETFSLQSKIEPDKEICSLYPIATKDKMPESPHVLVEIPSKFNIMKKEDITSAKHWRQRTKEIFTHYINHHNYMICDCITTEENLNKKSFYLLKAQ